MIVTVIVVSLLDDLAPILVAIALLVCVFAEGDCVLCCLFGCVAWVFCGMGVETMWRLVTMSLAGGIYSGHTAALLHMLHC